jgi:hypothetical protein
VLEGSFKILLIFLLQNVVPTMVVRRLVIRPGLRRVDVWRRSLVDGLHVLLNQRGKDGATKTAPIDLLGWRLPEDLVLQDISLLLELGSQSVPGQLI